MKILILNGPNLNMTGKREPDIYGSRTLDELIDIIRNAVEKDGVEIAHIQSNYEGRLIDELQTAAGKFDGVILNAGALTHYSYALRDAIVCCTVPVGEVHMSNIEEREPFRKIDVIMDVCAFREMGKGVDSYIDGIKKLKEIIK